MEQLEDKESPRAQTTEDQKELLTNVIRGCGLTGYDSKFIYTMPKEKLVAFPEILSAYPNLEDAYFASDESKRYLIFGLVDPNVPENVKPALFAYSIAPDAEPERVKNGVAGRCEQLQKIENLGVVGLSPENMAQFKNFIKKEGAGYASLTEPMADDISLYEKVPYDQLKYRDGRPVFDPIPPQKGYAWVQTGMEYSTANLPQEVKKMIIGQGFTLDQPTNLSADQNNYSFYLKDIMNDWPALRSQKNALRPNQIFYPTSAILNPDRETCRRAIKKLDYCISSPVGKDCGTDLFKNKIITLRCGDLKMAGGILGMKDEYENVLQRGAPYGVADLKNVLGKAQYGDIRESSIEKRINSVLNEEFKKFMF